VTEHSHRRDPRYSPGDLIISGVNRYVIVDQGQPVIEERSNGSPIWLTYKSRVMAERGLARTRLDLPTAEIFDKEEMNA
jgi:hypothetical protein